MACGLKAFFIDVLICRGSFVEMSYDFYHDETTQNGCKMAMAESPILNNQLKRFEEDADSFMRDHKRAMACLDLETLLAVGLTLFKVIELAEDRWSSKVRSGEIEFKKEDAESVKALYSWWRKPGDRILVSIKQFETEGYPVAGADEFREAIGRCIAPTIDVDATLDSIERLNKGEGRPLKEVMNELRRRRAS
jgi:hypothetical protein